VIIKRLIPTTLF